MKFTTWLDGLKSASRNRRARRARSRLSSHTVAGRQLAVERLEDRTVPAFVAPVNYGVGAAPQAIALGNFDAGGTLDLVVANYSTSNISVLLGNSDGTFQAAQNFGTSFGPLSVAVGDFNDDGMLDLASANAYDVSVLLGNGDGTFQDAQNLGIGTNPQSVAVGDFNGDGNLDLGVTSNYYYPGYGNYGRANVLLGNGDGSFSGPNTTFLGSGIHYGAVAADINGDLFEDFATFNFDYGYVEVLAGDSSGYLQGPSGFYTGYSSVAVAAGDVNGDGDTDLVAPNYYGNNVSVLLGNGLGGFGTAQYYAGGSTPSSVVLGDFNHDSKIDIATANVGGDNISVLRGRGNGTFTAPENFAAGSGANSIAAGDFNGDTWLDAATANYSGDNASVLINDLIWPPPPPPTVSVNDVTVTEGDTGTVDATFTVSLSFIHDADVTVHYTTADISATADSDYASTSGDVTIPAGQLSRTVSVAVTGDHLAELTETFAIDLTAPITAPMNATIGDGHGIGAILDDEPLVSVNDMTVTEGNTGSVNATFTVSLSKLSVADVTVHYQTANDSADGSDYAAGSGDVTIPAGQLSRTFTVAVTGDRLAESTETYFVNLSAPATAPINANIADGQGIGTILDNEPRIRINNVSKKEGNGTTTPFIFTVTLSAAHDQTVTVNYATADDTATFGSDYQAKSGTLTFAPGVTSMTITILVIRDKRRESNETFFVNLSNASSNSLIDDGQGMGTILDDDNHGKR